MVITGKSLPRRTFLKGVGAAVALPFLDSMVPAFAAPVKAAKAPTRLAFLYVPNGIDMKNWNIAEEGAVRRVPADHEAARSLPRTTCFRSAT